MNTRSTIKAIILILLILQALPAPAAPAARVAVIPFEIYSDESTASLKDIIAQSLSTYLAAEKRLEVVDQARVRSILADKASLTFNESVLRAFSEKLEAPFLVLGSMTKIGNNVSLDTYIFNGSSTPVFFKEFSEGKNLDSVTREMAGKVNARILMLAPPLPEQKEEEPPPQAVPPSPAPATALPAQPVAEETVTDDTFDLKNRQPEQTGRQQIPPPAPPEPEHAAVSPRDDGEPVTPTRSKREKADREESRPTPFSSTKPVKITSASLEADNKRNLVTFKGNVVAKQGDMVIFADSMTVDYEREGGIKKVEATGNVKMSQENRVATGTRIIFYNPEQKIVMTGNPKIWQGDNLISCEKITVLLEEDKIFFEGKVDSTIFPKSMDEEKQKDAKLIEPIPAAPPPLH